MMPFADDGKVFYYRESLRVVVQLASGRIYLSGLCDGNANGGGTLCGGCKRVQDALRKRVSTAKRKRRSSQHTPSARRINNRKNGQAAKERRSLKVTVDELLAFKQAVINVLDGLGSPELVAELKKLIDSPTGLENSPLARDPELFDLLFTVCVLVALARYIYIYIYFYLSLFSLSLSLFSLSLSLSFFSHIAVTDSCRALCCVGG
jgi:hypothetical protein